MLKNRNQMVFAVLKGVSISIASPTLSQIWALTALNGSNLFHKSADDLGFSFLFAETKCH